MLPERPRWWVCLGDVAVFLPRQASGTASRSCCSHAKCWVPMLCSAARLAAARDGDFLLESFYVVGTSGGPCLLS